MSQENVEIARFRGHRRAPGALLPLLALFGSLLFASALIPSATAASNPKVKSDNRCSDKKDKALRLDLKVKGDKTFGYFALPDRKPKGLVVFAHGVHNSAITWRDNLRETARRDDVVTVAMNYRHQPTNLDKDSPDYGRSTGWRVIEGAQDSVVAAKYLMRRCNPLKKRTSVMWGVSMGGNSSGLAVARGAERPGSNRPLFDYWFAIEGVTDVVQGYLMARDLLELGIDELAGFDLAALLADVEEDFGGTYEERPDFYERHSPVNRVADIKASGVKGVVLVHATDDPLYPMSATMFDRLREVGLPAQFFTVNPVGAPVGHGSEIDRAHPVIKVGFDRLAALFNDRARPRCFQEFGINGATGAITPDPASAPC